VTRLLLVRHAPTAATERGAFAADEPLGEPARSAAAALAERLPLADAILSSPAQRCRQTAAGAGFAPSLEPALAECRFGTWEGQTFAEITATGADLVEGWLRDPDAAPHGGESLTAFADRVRTWLASVAQEDDRRTLVAFTHAGVIRTAVVAALGAPLQAFWRIAAAPLSITELHAYAGVWTLVGLNLTGGGGA
jgi:broad specificity phosphatase PhoE